MMYYVACTVSHRGNPKVGAMRQDVPCEVTFDSDYNKMVDQMMAQCAKALGVTQDNVYWFGCWT